MANPSIFAAFERLWYHINNKFATVDQLDAKQNKITGTAGQFVVIGSDGNVTTKTVPNAEEASF